MHNLGDAIRRNPKIQNDVNAGSTEYEDFLAGLYHPFFECENLNKDFPNAPIDLELTWRGELLKLPILIEVELAHDSLFDDRKLALRGYIEREGLSCPFEKRQRLLDKENGSFKTVYLRGDYDKVVLVKGTSIINGRKVTMNKDYGDGNKVLKDLIFVNTNRDNCVVCYTRDWMDGVLKLLFGLKRIEPSSTIENFDNKRGA